MDALPSRLDFKLDLGSAAKTADQASGGGEFRWKTLGTVLGPLLLKIPHPLAKVLAPLAFLLGALLDSKADRQRQQLEEARQREQVRGRVRSALDDAVRQIDSQLRLVLTAQVQKAQTEVARSIHAERDELKKTVTSLAATLQQGQAQAAALRQSAQADIDRLNALLVELTPAV